MATIPSGYPSSANTGVPAGTQLKVYTGPMTITKDGTVIDGMIINGTLKISAANVVIKNSQINYGGTWGIDAESARNLTVQDSDITGPGYSGSANAGILGSGTFLRNDISKSENGIVLTGGSSTVKGNYVHDLQAAGSDPHYDGISVQGGQNGVLIEGNTVEGRDTSSIFIKNDFGSINNVVVKGNFLTGEPGYQIYVDGRASGGPITNIQISDNYIQKGFYGYYNIENSSPSLTGNVQLGTNQLPPAISTPSAPSAPSAPVVAEPSAPSKAPVINAPPTSVDSDSGSSGGQGTTINFTNKVPVAGSSSAPTGSHSSGSTSGDPVKFGGQVNFNAPSSSSHSNNPAFDFGSLKGNGSGDGHSGFQFNGLAGFNSGLDRVSDQFSSHSVNFAKAALVASYANSLFSTGDAGFVSGSHGSDAGAHKMGATHDSFHIL